MNTIADHLWQSTLFAGVVWLLTLVLRKNRARVRHGLWLAASVKFLIPFSLFIALGSLVPRRIAPVTTPFNMVVVMDQVSQPFTAPAVAVTMPPAPSSLPAILFGIWIFGFIGITCAWWVRWRRIRRAVRAGTSVNLNIPIQAMSSPTLLEPGVFGIFRPILLLPDGIFDRLTPAQLQAVIAHELCHVRQRDNLIATIHMFVETVFWFHPLVWWIGKRMVEERERACDEEVLRDFAEPKAYAEGILNVCKLYVESPLTCVSGVTGADLKKRIEAIMTNRVALRLNFAKKLALTAIATAAFALPTIVGIINAPAIRAQSRPASTPQFEVASIKPSDPSATPRGRMSVAVPVITSPGRLTVRNANLKELIKGAYALEDYQVSGGPNWIVSARFDVEAKAAATASRDQLLLMLRALLADRFRLAVRRQTKELPIYALVVAKNGPKFHALTAAEASCWPLCAGGRTNHMPLKDLPSLAAYLTRLGSWPAQPGRPVIDKTGLRGDFGIDVDMSKVFAILERSGEAPTNESLYQATVSFVEDELGLKLESQKAPIDILVIDHVERPSAN